MNLGKNKKKNRQNKPQNPNPPQNIGGDVKSEESVEATQGTAEAAKYEERVPEILSEVITLPVAESKEGNDNGEPKKPKRSRGKKKTSDKEDIVEAKETKLIEKTVEEAKSVINVKDNKNSEDTIQEPAARKKKGKNKASSETQIETTISQTEIKVDSEKTGIDTIKNIVESSEKMEQDTKPAPKKKNKKNKKNRTDSERSDKAEDLSCISAFQKILQTKNEVDIKVTEKDIDTATAAVVSDSSLSEPTVKEVEKNKFDVDKQISSKNEVLTDLKFEEQVTVVQAESINEDILKTKKKNKKEKKHSRNEEIAADDKNTLELETIIKPDETTEQKLFDQSHDNKDIKDVTILELQKPTEIVTEKTEINVEETVPKSKAKIAKPVEKKSKAKQTTDTVTILKKTEDPKSKIEISENLTQTDVDQEYSHIDVFSTICDTSKLSVKEATENKETIAEVPQMDNQTVFDKGYSVLDVFKCSAEKKPIETIRAKTPEIVQTKTKTEISRAKTPEHIKDQNKIVETDIFFKPDSLKSTKRTDLKDVETLESIEMVKPCQKKGKGKERVSHLEEQIKLTDVFENIATREDTTAESVEEPFEIVKPRHKKGKEKHECTELQPQSSEVQESVTTKPGNIEKSESIFDVTEPAEIAKPRQKKSKNKNFMPEFDEPIKMPEISEIITIKEDTTKNVKEPTSIVDVSLDIIESTPIEKDKEETLRVAGMSTVDDESKNIEQIPALISIIDKMSVPEEKPSKKRKKSPKPSKNSEKLPPLEEIPKADDSKIVTMITETVSADVQTPIPETVIAGDNKLMTNINPVMTQSTGSENTPDLIKHPRSTSADVIDNNNNMIIHEINIPESVLNVTFDIPDTPYIQGSGETPLSSPIVIATCVRVDELETKADTLQEPHKKTDLKSQVMEVNKDMEELRLSIERSLAEFTAMEKKEEESENKYEETHSNTFAIKLQQLNKTETVDKPQITLDSTTTSTEESKKFETSTEQVTASPEPPLCPARKDNKGKSKSKKKGKQESGTQSISVPDSVSATTTESKDVSSHESKKDEKTDQKDESKSKDEKEKGKQQSSLAEGDNQSPASKPTQEIQELLQDFDPIENFEDALTSSVDDVNQTFELIAEEALNDNITVLNADQVSTFSENPEINITEADDKEKAKEERQQRENPLVSQPKNLLGHPVIPARSNRTDYKKEKNKTPNTKQAKVKIKDSTVIENDKKQSKECQTESKPKFLKSKGINESVTCVTSENDEYVYKYSFRRVFLSSNCHVCKKELKDVRLPCTFCHLTFYCSQKHKDEDYPQHQALCFAVSTIVHLKGQKHIYADTAGVIGHNYRLLRMQTIVSCERILKRRLLPWEQEALLYPRVCAEGGCREWRQGKLRDCEECRQIAYCIDNPDHCPKTHARWCKSYLLYQKLVVYQLTQGRLEPKLPGRLLAKERISDNINRLLADMYDEKIDMNDMQYAALTQLGTAPLTAVYSYQLYRDKMKQIDNGDQKSSSFTIHVVGAELQFEADSLNKWETFFLHLRPDVEELKVVLVGPDLNPSNLPLDLLGKVKLCPTCRVDKRRIKFYFQDKQLYHEYWSSDDFLTPNIVCAFNPSINRTSAYDQTWSSTINCIFKLKVPFLLTAYTMNEIQRDFTTIKTCAGVEFNTISEAKFNPFASVRPDRNFITDDEMPLLFKNYAYMLLIGAF